MNCWKTIRISRDYGTLRLIIYSGCTILFSFLFYYLVISSIIKTPKLIEISFHSILLSIILLVFSHKLLHLLPLWICGKKAILKIDRSYFFPLLTIKIKGPLSKSLYLATLFMPGLIITSASALASTMYPMYIAYISILTSIHFGLVFFDIVYISYILKAPKRCLVEKHSEGFNILLRKI
ncbi:DUF3267 domain-containing protein [Bacillus suaedae]|uniref:DUF3267 domain-containing protein n=1 Tax=Halalkalibacter suaedae TaxID=2822140 RepID=A0A940WVN6_9BACI|nr:DUF3267 domain-containing protein [Bacillus suaedae]MBP3951452.1 DUF3267 domain-containing protein [Bacillus suaedae]